MNDEIAIYAFINIEANNERNSEKIHISEKQVNLGVETDIF